MTGWYSAGIVYVPTTGCVGRSVTRAVAALQGRQCAFSLTRSSGCPKSRLQGQGHLTRLA
jgi:hypothetical protein